MTCEPKQPYIVRETRGDFLSAGNWGRIVGGQLVADRKEWPWMAAFRGMGGPCSASIIGDRYLVTAARVIKHFHDLKFNTVKDPLFLLPLFRYSLRSL